MNDDQVFMTYDRWKRAGRHVRRGERSVARDKYGNALFSEEQTDETISMYPADDGGYDDDGPSEFDLNVGWHK